jgi:VanZ family protein
MNASKWSLVLGAAWLLLITYLFLLPGSSFRTDDWMSKVQLDKWIHIFFFLVLVLLWSKGLKLGNRSELAGLVAVCAVYGIMIEIIQFRFVPNRSFDLLDIVADVLGAIAGAWLWKRKKLNNNKLGQ